MIDPLPDSARAELVGALARISTLLGATPGPLVIRPHRPGDIGWVISRHGALYAAEHGFDSRFEALVASIAGGFLAQHDSANEACRIAERDGTPLGSIFIMRGADATAKLRLLIVEPGARGQGIAAALVEQALSFARNAGYRRVALWTQEALTAARRLYEQKGFRLVRSAPHAQFGPPMVGEDWELELR